MSDIKRIFARNLSRLLDEYQETQADLAEKMHVAPSSVSGWCTGAKMPRMDKVEWLASHFNVSRADLIEDHTAVLPTNAIPYHTTGMAPVLGRIPAGAPLLAKDDIEGYEPVDASDPSNYYWLRVQGDSMINAGINSGDLVLIHVQNYAENGQIVACRVNGDEATLKRYREQKASILLMPENPNYEPYVVSKKDFNDGYAGIMGVAVEIKRKL